MATSGFEGENFEICHSIRAGKKYHLQKAVRTCDLVIIGAGISGLTAAYKTGRLPLSACINILKAWIIRFQQEYLTSQTFLEPYPEDLATLDTTSNVEERDYWK